MDSRPSLSAAEHADPFAHPDAQRRFRVMANAEELRQALDHPWDKWIVFLHPAQRQIVERDYNGPARVAGSAGTGKTVVALHRAVHLARTHRDARILLATFSEALAAVLQVRLTRLISNEPRLAERLEVHSMSGIARRLYEANLGTPKLIAADEVRELLDEAASEVEGHRFSSTFVWTEWSKVVDAWQLETWEDYRDVARLGRKTRLAEKQRAVLWSIFLKVREALAERELLTECGMFRRLERHLSKAGHTPFEYCVIDEAQDVGVAELRLLSVLGGDRPNSLFFAGDLGQRIFQTPFSWRSLGVDVRGRSQILRVNYRTSHQIRRQADRLLPSALADVDGVTEQRGGTDLSIQWTRAAREGSRVRGEKNRRVSRSGCEHGRTTATNRTRSECSSDPTPRWSAQSRVSRTRAFRGALEHPSRWSVRVRRGRNHAPRQGPGVPGCCRRGL